MHITKVVVKNYKVLKDILVNFNEHLNIIVGDNECGKSTLLEAINLGLSSQINGRNIHYELHPLLFNQETVNTFFKNLNDQKKLEPPEILIEVYLNNVPQLALLKGSNNSLKENVPGVRLLIKFDESYGNEYAEYIKSIHDIKTIPTEYYKIEWLSFADNSITARSIPVKPTFIDTTTIKHTNEAGKYVLDIIKDHLPTNHKVNLSLSYRKMKDSFLNDKTITEINTTLARENSISQKTLSISFDTTTKANWENNIIPCLDSIPLPLVGKGEQNIIKIKLALKTAGNSHIYLIEEPENHLSHTNLNKLIKSISEQALGKQLIITTHSSFVLNKLGIESVLLFCKNQCTSLKSLSEETYHYFKKLPGHDTLRLILAQKAILVEGPSDELIVQKAFVQQYGKMPLEMGIDIICVKSLAFKRFLEISDLLKIKVQVITDNDGNIDTLREKYKNYLELIYYDDDINYPTLEPQLLKANSLSLLNQILERNFGSETALLTYMKNNKTDCALKIFDSETKISMPDYIVRAISEE